MAYQNIRKGMKRKAKPIRKALHVARKARGAMGETDRGKKEKSKMLEEKLADKEL